MKNETLFEYDDVQDSIPKATAGTGTISSANNSMIVGVSTKFKTEAQIGDYIYIKAQNDFRRIETIVSDTVLYIRSAFGSALSGASYAITPAPRFTFVRITVTKGSAAAPAIIDGLNFVQDEVVEFNKNETYTAQDYILPIDVDCDTNAATVKISAT